MTPLTEEDVRRIAKDEAGSAGCGTFMLSVSVSVTLMLWILEWLDVLPVVGGSR